VLAHLVNPFEFLTQLRRLAKTGGRLILTFPNVHNWRSIVGYALGGRFSGFFGPNWNNNHPLHDQHIFIPNHHLVRYDLIYMKDTFHHLEPRDRIVAKIASLLAPGGKVVIIEPNAWNPAIQYKMFLIRGFNTIIEKIDKATGEHFIYGNERLVSGGSIAQSFETYGVKGGSRLFRLVPTALASKSAVVGFANLLETLRIEPLLVPMCIHSVYCGTKT